MQFIKRWIKKSLNSLGLEIHYFNPNSPSVLFQTALKTFHIEMVLDVGANQGQYGRELRSAGYQGQIISFEPLSEAFKVLEKACLHDSKWHAYPRCAIGEMDGNISINVSQNSVSSSVLPMLNNHLDAAPESAYVSEEKVDIYTLDTIWSKIKKVEGATLLKIDTQGYEWQVLNGAKDMLSQVHGVQMELSLLPLYQEQYLWRDCIDRLDSEGFTLWSLQPAFVDTRNGRTMQWDGLFFRA
jgi:FkbM family methyltransferase